METIQSILTRRSIRKYETRMIEEQKIHQLLEAAMYAPSARNTQPWHFIVINEREMLNKIMKVHPYSKMLAEAPVAVLICGDKNREPNEGYLNTNCSAATQNLLLAAHDLGLGSVWLGVYPREERMKGISEIVGLPSSIIPISLVVLGYPKEVLEKPKRFLPERIHYNKWE